MAGTGKKLERFVVLTQKYQYDCGRCRRRQSEDEFFRKDCGTCPHGDLMEENVEAWEMFLDYLVFGPRALDFPWFLSKPEDEQYLLKEKLKIVMKRMQEILLRGGS